MRNLGLQVIRLISLIRFYGVSAGLQIFRGLLFDNKGVLTIKSKYFKNVIQLRKDQSDPYIFEQVFCEQQYNYIHPEPEKVRWIIDAGANIGLAAIYFTAKFPNAKIVSVEPDKNNFELLKKNTSGYNNIICVHGAIWHKAEKLDITNKEEKSAGFMMGKATTITEDLIQGFTLDDLIAQNQMESVDVIKLDIEGSEKEVFQFNEGQWLQQCKCLIVELHDWMKPGTSKVFFEKMAAYDWVTYVKGENIICHKSNQQ